MAILTPKNIKSSRKHFKYSRFLGAAEEASVENIRPVLWKKNVENSLSISQTIAWPVTTRDPLFDRPVENRKKSTKKIFCGAEKWRKKEIAASNLVARPRI
ncbi:MAG: hypothetical protein K1X52_15375 [Pyrinomonadaceae bacterium]|nr:hypothetical protein [Pyrinomonadaceae bacterium]